ncbi:MAG: prolipoprotein diacylglyceryl transferase [Clostridiales bacterium]|nr:prolipoprotein diacylglyceryl transferase [Clostridiales bacterium]
MERTVVFFKALEDGITVNSVLADFNIFGMHLTIRWYGVIIAFGFLLAVLFGGRMAYKWKMNLDKMIDVLIYGTIFAIVGARLYYCIFEWRYYSAHPLEIFRIWEGGLAIYGGLIGGIIAAYIVCRIRKLNFFNLLDLAAMGFLIGQGIGRWGNFTNQEAFGTNTNLPWGMWSPKVAEYIADHQADFAQRGFTVNAGTFLNKAYVHPTFLYESLWCLVGFLLLYIICKKYRKFSGQIFLCYGIWYGLGRMIIEGFRTDSLYIGNSTIRVSQLLSALILLVSAVLLMALLRKYKKNPQPIEGVDYFPDEQEQEAVLDNEMEKDEALKTDLLVGEGKATDLTEPEIELKQKAEPESSESSENTESSDKMHEANEENEEEKNGKAD